MLFLTVSVVVLSLLWWWVKIAKIGSCPPGPYGLPLLGYLPIFWAEDILKCFEALHKKYGTIFSVNLGPGKRIVVIGDYEIMKEIFKNDSLSSRPPELNWFNEYFRYGNGTDSRGLIFSHGSEWTEQRRFALRNLRDFGFGKSSMEEMVHEEVLSFCENLDKDLDQPISLNHKFNISVVNSLWRIMTGKRSRLDDKDLLEVVKMTSELSSDNSNDNILQVFPFMRHIAPKLTGWTRMMEVMTPILNYVENVVTQHITTFHQHPERKDQPSDFIDAYLSKMDESQPGSSFHAERGVQSLNTVIVDLLIAGSETTSTALTFIILYMIKNPEIQAKVQQEIDQVVGTARLPLVSDRPNLPLTEAVMQETLRMGCIAPLSVPHHADMDVPIFGGKLVIPAGTTVMPNLSYIVNNPKVFPNPEKFNPDRFLDSQGKYIKNEHNIIFGTGKRDCLGKSLALTELYLFFSALMQKYSFHWIDEDHLEQLVTKPKIGFIQSPPPYQVIVKKRN